MIAIIAAMAANRVIGSDGKIPWDLPEDRKHFKDLTMGQVVVMGRRTWKEIGTPLAGRVTVLVSSNCRIRTETMFTVSSLEEAIRKSGELYPDKDIFLCGGTSVYEEGMKLADRIYLTVLEQTVEGDTYFPAIGKEYDKKSQEKREGFCYEYYEKRKEAVKQVIQ